MGSHLVKRATPLSLSYEEAASTASVEANRSEQSELVKRAGRDVDGDPVVVVRWAKADVDDVEGLCKEFARVYEGLRAGKSKHTVLAIGEEGSGPKLSSLYAKRLVDWAPGSALELCKRFIILHPGWQTRAKLVLLLPSSLYAKVACMERIEFVKDYIPGSELERLLPKSSWDHDALIEDYPLLDYGLSTRRLATPSEQGGDLPPAS